MVDDSWFVARGSWFRDAERGRQKTGDRIQKTVGSWQKLVVSCHANYLRIYDLLFSGELKKHAPYNWANLRVWDEKSCNFDRIGRTNLLLEKQLKNFWIFGFLPTGSSGFDWNFCKPKRAWGNRGAGYQESRISAKWRISEYLRICVNVWMSEFVNV